MTEQNVTLPDEKALPHSPATRKSTDDSSSGAAFESIARAKFFCADLMSQVGKKELFAWIKNKIRRLHGASTRFDSGDIRGTRISRDRIVNAAKL